MIDTSAFRSLTYGLYIISSERDGKPVGCVVNTFAQVTSTPAQVSVAINKENYTTEGIRQAGAFEAAALDESASMDLIGTFGFHSSADTNKFANCQSGTSAQGLKYVSEHVAAHFSVKVSQELDLGSHILFIGEVVEAELVGSVTPMSYAYYHQVKGGKTPPKASSYNGGDAEGAASDAAEAGAAAPRTAWRCTICGHIEYAEELPDDFTCPICGVGKELFERIEL